MKKSQIFLILCFSTYLGYSQCNEPLITDFECDSPSQTIIGSISTIENIVSGGINTSANIGEFTDDGTMGFDNLTIDYSEIIDLSTNSILTLKFFSPNNSVQILAKLEGGNDIELFSDFSDVGVWQEFSFDFSAAIEDQNTRVVLFVNPGIETGTSSDIYYFDDLKFDSSATSSTCENPLITDFECSNPSQPISGALVTVENSFSGGINTSPNIGRYTDNGTEGFDALIIDFETQIDLSVNNILSVKLYSESSIQILAKLEGGNTEPELFSDFSEVNAWQEFLFDFGAFRDNGNTRVVLFFNPNVTSGTTSDIYFIDDIQFQSNTASTSDAILRTAKLFPNPVVDVLNISSDENINNYQILDITGKTIYSKINNSSNAIDLSAMNAGIYFIKMETATSKSVIKFVKK